MNEYYLDLLDDYPEPYKIYKGAKFTYTLSGKEYTNEVLELTDNDNVLVKTISKTPYLMSKQSFIDIMKLFKAKQAS